MEIPPLEERIRQHLSDILSNNKLAFLSTAREQIRNEPLNLGRDIEAISGRVEGYFTLLTRAIDPSDPYTVDEMIGTVHKISELGATKEEDSIQLMPTIANIRIVHDVLLAYLKMQRNDSKQNFSNMLNSSSDTDQIRKSWSNWSRLDDDTELMIRHTDLISMRAIASYLDPNVTSFRVLQEMGEGYCLVGPKGDFLFANPAITKIFGVADNYISSTKNGLVGTKYGQYTDEATKDVVFRFYNDLWQHPEKGNTQFLTYKIRTPDGEKDIQISAWIKKDSAGKPMAFHSVVRDVTELNKAVEALRESERRFKETANLCPIGICEADLQGNAVYANRKGLSMFGHTEQDLKRGLSIWEFISEDDRQRAELNIKRSLSLPQGQEPQAHEYRINTVNGPRTFNILSSPIYQEGNLLGIRCALSDITEQVDLNRALETLNELLAKKNAELTTAVAELNQKNIHDDLTGLLKRDHFLRNSLRDELGRILVSREEGGDQNFAIGFGDIDNFKQFNDTYGQVVGDYILRKVGDKFRECLPNVYKKVRYGGEEFLVLLPGLNLNRAYEIIDNLRKDIESTQFRYGDIVQGMTPTQLNEFKEKLRQKGKEYHDDLMISITMTFGVYTTKDMPAEEVKQLLGRDIDRLSKTMLHEDLDKLITEDAEARGHMVNTAHTAMRQGKELPEYFPGAKNKNVTIIADNGKFFYKPAPQSEFVRIG